MKQLIEISCFFFFFLNRFDSWFLGLKNALRGYSSTHTCTVYNQQNSFSFFFLRFLNFEAVKVQRKTIEYMKQKQNKKKKTRKL